MAEPARRRAKGRVTPAPAPRPARAAGGDREPDLLHHRQRLGLVSALAAADSLSFNDLKGVLDITDGNLSVHARKLEEAGFLTCRKTFENRRPRTEYRLTAAGRQALARYLSHMEAIIRAAKDTLGR